MSGHPLVPVVTFKEADDPLQLMNYLIENDIHCIEVTLRTTQGIKAIATLRQTYGASILVGAGTVTTTIQVDELKEVGVDFLVSPGITSSLQKAMQASGIPYLPGVATPGEILKAMEMGLRTLKFFPANLFGGLDALKAYEQVFPDIQFCPTGGVTQDTCQDYLALQNVFAVGGTWFQKQFSIKARP